MDGILNLKALPRTCNNSNLEGNAGYGSVLAKLETNRRVASQLNKKAQDSELLLSMRTDFIKKVLSYYVLEVTSKGKSSKKTPQWQFDLKNQLKVEMPYLLLPAQEVGIAPLSFGTQTLAKSLSYSFFETGDAKALKTAVQELNYLNQLNKSVQEAQKDFSDIMARLYQNAGWSFDSGLLLSQVLTPWKESVKGVHTQICEEQSLEMIEQLPEFLVSYVTKRQNLDSNSKKSYRSYNELPEWRKNFAYYCHSSFGVTPSMQWESRLKLASFGLFVGATLAALPTVAIPIHTSVLLAGAGASNLTAHGMRFHRRGKQVEVQQSLHPVSLDQHNFSRFGLSSEIIMAGIYTLGLNVANQTIVKIMTNPETGKLIIGRALFPSPMNGASFETMLAFWGYNVSTTALSALEFVEHNINPLKQSEFYIGTLQEYLTSIFVVPSNNIVFDTLRSAIAAFAISNHFEDIWLLHGSKKPDQVLSRFEFGYHGSGISLGLRFIYYITLEWLPKIYGPLVGSTLKRPIQLTIDTVYQLAWAEVYNQIRVKFIQEPKFHHFPFGIWDAFGDTPWGKKFLETKEKMLQWAAGLGDGENQRSESMTPQTP